MNHGSKPQWRKSSHSTHEGGACVEIAELSGRVSVRDSKNPSGRVHMFEKLAFSSFVRAVRVGRLDL